MRRYIYNFVIMILTATLLSACGSSDKGPAETALKAAEEAINTAKGEVSKYMPAVAKASSVKVKAAEELTLLKMPVPEALKN